MSDMTMTVLAMAGGGSGQQGGAGLLGMIVPMLLIFAIFYFMLIRPQQRREKERQALINAIKSGDRILFCGGMIGSVVNVKDRILVVKVADNVKVEVARGSVLRVLDKDDNKDVDTNG
jgi:preprotein translocase subunit YajC